MSFDSDLAGLRTDPLPEDLKAVYQEFLANGTYGTPAARRNFIRPVSLSSSSSLDQLESNIRPRMERSRRFRPSQYVQRLSSPGFPKPKA